MKNSNLLKIFATYLCFTNITANATDSLSPRPDSHAPIGIMRDHVHKKNEYMLSYRYEFMTMKGLRSDDSNISTNEALNKYMMVPKKMSMKMHMVGAMYGVTDNLTLALMGSFIEKDMKMIHHDNKTNEQEISGFGDMKLNTMYKFFDNSKSKAQFNLGISIPSGSIKEKNSHNTRAGYPMQFGSGSYEILPGISYSFLLDSYSYGAQINGVFRLNNNNNNGYKLGNSYNLTSWVAKNLNESFSISSRLNYTITQKIKGVDEALNSTMSPANDTSSTGGKKLEFLVGANFIASDGILKGNRFGIEGGVPVYQKLNGIQLENDYKVTLGWQKSF